MDNTNSSNESILKSQCICIDNGVTKTLVSNCPVHQAMARENAVQDPESTFHLNEGGIPIPPKQEQTPSPIQEEIRPHQQEHKNLRQGNEKFPTPESRAQLFEDYIKYMESGKPKDYFPQADPETMSRYFKVYESEIGTELKLRLEQAERVGQSKLLDIGYAGMLGKIPGFKEKTWQFIAMNRTKFKIRSDETSGDEKIDNKTVIMMPTKLPAQEGVQNEQE